MKNKTTIKSSLLLLTTAAVWGVAFVAQSVGMDYVGPFTFNAVRFLLGGAVLLPLAAFRQKRQEKTGSVDHKKMLLGGICCGLALCMASLFQQNGILHTSVGNAGFITALYIIFVPVLGIFFGKKPPKNLWLSALMALCGLYLLCVKEGMFSGGNFSLNKGDGFVLACAVIFAVHIMAIDHFAVFVDGVVLACMQFFVSGILCGVGALLWETPTVASLCQGLASLLYAGVLSCGVGYTLQIIGQRDTDPAVASLILSLESVISALAGWLLLGETLGARAIFGCVLVFAAVLMVQLRPGNGKKFPEN